MSAFLASGQQTSLIAEGQKRLSNKIAPWAWTMHFMLQTAGAWQISWRRGS